MHPPDETIGAAECTLFGAAPFEGQREDDWGWTGAQIVLRLASGCQGSFEVVVSEEEGEIDGFPAWARHLTTGEGPNRGEPSAYQYTVNLNPGQPCETGRWFFGRTEVDAPGDFAENSALLDSMIQSVMFTDIE